MKPINILLATLILSASCLTVIIFVFIIDPAKADILAGKFIFQKNENNAALKKIGPTAADNSATSDSEIIGREEIATSTNKNSDSGAMTESGKLDLASAVRESIPDTDKCKMIHRGAAEPAEKINIVIVGADALFAGRDSKYSNNPVKLKRDTETAVDGLLSVSPYRELKDDFNFYLAGKTIQCPENPYFNFRKTNYHTDTVCPGWKEAVADCTGAPDISIILTPTTTKEGIASGNLIIMGADKTTWLHEVSHVFGLADEGYYTGAGPNIFPSLDECGKPECALERGSDGIYELKYVDVSGGTCCQPLVDMTVAESRNSGYYSTNEKSIMRANILDISKDNFSLAAKTALEKKLRDTIVIKSLR